MSGKTPIQYYIPEDGDDLEHPNVYSVDAKIASLSLKDIRESFPIPGTYYFRFKRLFKKTWTEENEIVPSFEGSIYVKATRLPALAARVLKASVKKPTPQFRAAKSSVSPKTSIPIDSPKSKDTTSTKSTKSAPVNSVDDFIGSASPISPVSAHPKVTSSDDVFDSFSYTPPVQKKTDDVWSNIVF